MKRKYFLLIVVFSILANIGYTQCLIDTLFKTIYNKSKFETINYLEHWMGFIPNTTWHLYKNKYYHPSYLEDSVYIYVLTYKETKLDCFSDIKSAEFTVTICDDKVYELSVDLAYKRKNYIDCFNNYGYAVKQLMKNYPYYEEYVVSNARGEQFREGFDMNKLKISDDSNRETFIGDVDKVSIEYGMSAAGLLPDFDYKILIFYRNTNNVKLDCRLFDWRK